jgi:hypothetical protein
MFDEFILSKEDINKNKPIYEILNLVQHRHKIKFDKVLYIDSKKGELLPFLGLKNAGLIQYFHLTTDAATIKNNPLFKNIHNLSVIHNKSSIEYNAYDLVISDQPNALRKYSEFVRLNGHAILLSNAEYSVAPDFIRLYNDEKTGLKCFKKVDAFHQIKNHNEFSSGTPIKNKYELLKLEHDEQLDVNIIINKLSDHQVQVTVIRFDDENTYDGELKIKIYNDGDDNSEIITIPKLNTVSVHKSEHIVSNVIIQEDERTSQTQRIPKILCQTLDDDVVGEIHARTVLNLKALHPEYSYVFFDGRARRQFIKEHFDSAVLDAYDGYVSGAFKADIFRYCWLYMNGGIYIDCKMINRIPFREIIATDQEVFLCKDRIPSATINGIIGISAKNEDMMRCVYECVARFESKIHKKVSFGSLYHTGPYLFYSCMSKYKTSCKFDVPFNDQDYKKAKIVMDTCAADDGDGRVVCNVWFKRYYESYNKIHKKPIWSEQWAKGEIYYGKKVPVQNMNKTFMMVYPNQLNAESKEPTFAYDSNAKAIFNDIQDNLKCKLIEDVNDIEKLVLINKLTK